jgi:hypothetical protein
MKHHHSSLTGFIPGKQERAYAHPSLPGISVQLDGEGTDPRDGTEDAPLLGEDGCPTGAVTSAPDRDARGWRLWRDGKCLMADFDPVLKVGQKMCLGYLEERSRLEE